MVKTFAILGLTVALYAILALYFGWDNLKLNLSAIPTSSLIALGALSLINYILRFARWSRYLQVLDAPLPWRSSLNLYFATYVMVITPGKIGEIFKAGILRERYGVPLAKGVPIVVAERIYDLLVVIILAVVGIFFWPGSLTGMTTGLVAAAGIPVLVFLFQQPGVRQILVRKAVQNKLLARHQVGVEDSLNSLGRLLDPFQTVFSLAISTLAWLAECLGLYVVCHALGFPLGWGESVFIYAAGTLVGSLSFLPGGLGGTEATIIYLLTRLEMNGATAAAVALLVRLFTLWLAVIIGLLFFLVARKDLLRDPQEQHPA
ncbi:hypothetical protein CSA17_03655 [bacterium DOLJORAL78_65_58]|nr:MAG: hypothetical protein CSB20_07590 [bacterium DOLZORAL124_64_63]PIE76154.1 MAG: hypothetical protein CSA17_03655 [bacterium DOLJORAL78_65_58]